MTSLITTELVRLGADWGSDKHDVIRALAAVVDDAGEGAVDVVLVRAPVGAQPDEVGGDQ